MHKNYLSIYLYAIYTPPNFITMIICIERKKQSDYCQLNKPCSTSSWVSKKNDKKSGIFFWGGSLAINEDGLYWLKSSRNIVIDDFKRLKALERADLRGKKVNNFKK